MRSRKAWGVVAAVALTGLLIGSSARAAIVERVVAVVGDRPILFSELRERGEPYIAGIEATARNPWQAAAEEAEMYRGLLQRMIDDRLEEQAAEKAHLTVRPDEVERALEQIAAKARLSVPQLIAEARKQRLTEQGYREEIRSQLLEGKLLQLRVVPRVRVTEQEARSAYGRYVAEVSRGNAGTAPVPSFEDVEAEMRERAMGDAIEAQRRAWLADLRRGVYVDVRL